MSRDVTTLDAKVGHQHHGQPLVIGAVGVVEQGLKVGLLALLGGQRLFARLGKT